MPNDPNLLQLAGITKPKLAGWQRPHVTPQPADRRRPGRDPPHVMAPTCTLQGGDFGNGLRYRDEGSVGLSPDRRSACFRRVALTDGLSMPVVAGRQARLIADLKERLSNWKPCAGSARAG